MSNRNKILLLLVATIICYSFIITQKPTLINQIQPETELKNTLPTDYFIIETSHVNPLLSDNQNIFFIESSEPNNWLLTLSTRQVCAIESAATQNPNSQIFVYLSKIIGLASTQENIALWEVIKSLPNVHMKLINSAEFTENTPVERLFNNGLNSRKEWQTYHKSDILRYTLLWKFPGTYLDLDVISMQPLSGLGTNFAVIQSLKTTRIQAGAGIVNFDQGETGRKLARTVLNLLAVTFDGTKSWDLSSVGVLSRSIEKLCGTTKLYEMTPDRCGDFQLYPKKMFYAIDYDDYLYFFKEEYYDKAMQMLIGSIGSHIWNYLSHGVKVNKTQRVALNELAKNYCPNTFAVPGEYF